jgi:general secretion pathway protein B
LKEIAMTKTIHTLAPIAALFAATASLAQVTPSEPFGGRPFGSAPASPPVVVQQAAPQQPVVVVQPPAVPAPAPADNMAGPMNRPSSVTGAPAGTQNDASLQQQQAAPTPRGSGTFVPPAPAPAAAATPAAPMTPPIQAQRNVPAASAAAQAPVKGLPADAPRIVISGSIFSPHAANRMVIANGQMFREGAEIASGVKLEEVRPESAVLGYRGARYNVFF